jgi:diguanylate cyclase (GGDEF)-like protein/PAS domain S-box-containing protein
MFKRIRIRTLITVVIVLLQTLLVLVSASGLYGIDTATRAHEATYINVSQLLAIERQEQGLARARMKLDRIVADPAANDREAALDDASALIARSDLQWRMYRRTLTRDHERSLASEVDAARQRLKTYGFAPLIASLRTHDQGPARALSFAALNADYSAYTRAVAKLEDDQIDESTRLYASAVQAEQWTMGLTAFMMLAGLVTALLAAFALRKTISRPLRHALDLLARIEAGNFSDTVVIERSDEIGALLAGMKRMKDALNASLGKLKASEQRFRALYEATPAMLHSTDCDGRLMHVSETWLATLGYTRDEVMERLWTDFLTPDSRRRAIGADSPCDTPPGWTAAAEYRMRCKNGALIDISVASIVERDHQGYPVRYLTVLEDVTERKRAQAELAAQLERLRVTLHSIGDGVITTDANGNVEYLNPVAEQLTGWHNADARGQWSSAVFRIVNETTRAPAKNPITVCLSEDRIVGLANHTILISRDGSEYHIEDSAAPIKDSAGRTLGVVLVFHDVSEQHRLSQEMTHRATHDMLTGLLNRDEFERRLHAALTSTRTDGSSHALMYIDLDQFKLVNDAGGHAAGDRLLRQVVEVIRKLIRPADTFARLGGDEFGLIVERCSIQTAQDIADRICRSIDAFRFRHGNLRLHTGASIGLVPLDGRWPNTANVLQAADSACYAAKEAGRNRVHTYVEADQMIESRREDMQWVRRLEQAIDTGRFVLHWQHITPLVDSDEGIHGEMLLRLVGEDGKLIPPGAFLPSADRFQMTSRIDRWVIQQVFAWMTEHRAMLSNVSTVAVNLSGLSIGDRDFQQYALDLLNAMPFDHEKLCFEITETAAITNLGDATCFFRTMQARGVRFALDDFGSGVSSFGYLKSLPVEYLKIDGQFIRNLEHDLVDQATVRCIRDIARITGKKTIAEFVESETVETLLREIGIDYAQGFLRHRPEALELVFSPSA